MAIANTNKPLPSIHKSRQDSRKFLPGGASKKQRKPNIKPQNCDLYGANNTHDKVSVVHNLPSVDQSAQVAQHIVVLQIENQQLAHDWSDDRRMELSARTIDAIRGENLSLAELRSILRLCNLFLRFVSIFERLAALLIKRLWMNRPGTFQLFKEKKMA